MKSLRHYLSIVLTVFAFTGCAALGGTGDIFSMIGGTSSTGATGTPTGSGATSDGTTDSTTGEDAAGTTGGSELMPTIPVASGDSFLISDTNSSSSSQLLGTGLDASYSLLVSTAGSRNENPSLGQFFARYSNPSQPPLKLRGGATPLFNKEGAAQPGALMAGIDAFIQQTLQPLHLVYDYYKLKTGQLSAGQFFAQYINPSQPGALLWGVIPTAFASTTTCSGIVVPISADGTVSYELPNVAAGMSYSIQYVNTAAAAAGDCSAVGEPVYESPVSAVQFVAGDAASSNSIAFDGTDSACSIVTDASTATNIMQEIAYTTDTGFEVAATTAEQTTCAVDASLISDGLEIDFNSSDVLSVRDENVVTSTGAYSSSTICSGTCTPIRMKAKGEAEYYSIQDTAGQANSFIYDLYGSSSQIHFLKDVAITENRLFKTLAYDVDDSQTALVVFETVAGETMVATKTVYGPVSRLDSAKDPSDPQALSLSGTPIDLWSYVSFDTNDIADGAAVLLTTTHLYQISYDAMGTTTTSETTSSTTNPCEGVSEEEAEEMDCTPVTTSSTTSSTSGDAKSVAIASSLALAHTASAMVISDAKDAVYILNTDSSVTIVDPVTLTATAGPVAYDSDVDGTITADEMKAALGYDFDYALTSIKYVTTDDGAGGSAHYLLLGANGLDSVLTLLVE